MSWFSKSSITLHQLLLKKSDNGLPPKQKILERLVEHFGFTTEQYIAKTELSDYSDQLWLYQQTFAELAAALYEKMHYWHKWQKPQVEAIVPEVVAYVRWKLAITHYSSRTYTQGQLYQLAYEGSEKLSGMVEQLRSYDNPSKPTRGKRLYSYVKEQALVQRMILIRTLRCFIVKNQYEENKNSRLLLAFTSDLQLSLKPSFFVGNLYEQLALSVFLYFNQQEAGFITDTKTKLYHYVFKFVKKTFRNPEDIALALVSDTHAKVCQKLSQQVNQADTFFIDLMMSSYVIHYYNTHRSHFLWPYQKEQHQESFNEETIEFDENSISSDYEGLSEGQRLQIKKCLKSLSLRCQVMIRLRIYSDYYGETPSYEVIAEQMMLTKDTIEKSYPICEKKLKKCLLSSDIRWV